MCFFELCKLDCDMVLLVLSCCDFLSEFFQVVFGTLKMDLCLVPGLGELFFVPEELSEGDGDFLRLVEGFLVLVGLCGFFRWAALGLFRLLLGFGVLL